MKPLPPLFPPSTASKLCELLNRISFRDQRNKIKKTSNVLSSITLWSWPRQESKGVRFKLVLQDFYKLMAYVGLLSKQDYIDP